MSSEMVDDAFVDAWGNLMDPRQPEKKPSVSTDAGGVAPTAEPEHHIFIKYDVQPPEWHCTHCGDRTPIPVPIEVTLMIKKGKAYEQLHEDCERAEPE